MFSVLFGVFALIHVTMLVLVVGLWRRSRQHVLALLVLVAAALTWDNAILAAGRFVGTGELLETLSIPRYVGHALFTPLLIPLAVALAARFGLGSFAKRWVAAAFGLLAAALIGLGVAADVIALQLEPRTYADALRYANAAAGGPPIPAIVTILTLVGIGVAIWVKAKWTWLFTGAVAMFVAAAAGVSLVWLQNVGEVILILSVVATAYAALAKARPRPSPALPQDLARR